MWEYFPARNIISENEKTEVEVPEEWLSVCVRLYFHSAYHDAKIYVNGELAAEHMKCGYTHYTVNLSE